MVQADTTYALSAAELDAVRTLLVLQKHIGQDAVASPSYNIVYGVMDDLNALSVSYPSLANALVKGWVDQLYTALISTNTCYQRGFAELYVALIYGNYVGTIGGLDRKGPGGWNDLIPPDDSYDYYVAFTRGLQDADDPNRYLGPWKDWGTGSRKDWRPWYPQAPAVWVTAVNGVFTAWGNNPPSTIIDKGNGDGYDGRVPDFEANVVSSGWTDFDKIKTSTAGVWKAQAQTATTMLAATTQTTDAYFFLLHLLIALATGDATSQALAQRIVSASTSSPEYPNDTFINQLVYLSLMYAADPGGPFGWNNQQLQQLVGALVATILSQDPASVAIKASLETHSKVLNSDSAYPMQDPYCPSIGFSQRRTDTLFALDKARATIRAVHA